ncbi:GNAT family N-acetyltransferase [Phenylobacterium sp.]|uniref:GNAT family N-acetyltransferase n=1 Tax=Phenylobacterium sp. TaxID=1871053 RepID=UPI00281122C8|nr:GNAT family N-acetyltransferase [Phenylobacterium sp.]
MQVRLESAVDRRATIENLFQFYVHDFAEFWESRRVDLDSDGRFPAYPPLSAYWVEPGAEPLLVTADGRLAGFVLVNRRSRSGRPCDFNMDDFWIARHYRREGVGRVAAGLAMRARPGLWEIAIARWNLPAQAFWRRVADELASGPVEAREQQDAHWDGPVLRLTVADGLQR